MSRWQFPQGPLNSFIKLHISTQKPVSVSKSGWGNLNGSEHDMSPQKKVDKWIYNPGGLSGNKEKVSGLAAPPGQGPR